MPQKQQNPTVEKNYIREPAVAGAFYDGDAESLRKTVEQFINNAKDVEVPGKLIGIVSPHAGYIYSGSVAGYSYKQIMGRKYKTVIVLAPSHRARFPGVSVIPCGKYKTPLGEVSIDEEMAKKIMARDSNSFNFIEQAHSNEHSLEVQVPFLQVALGEGWKIVPIVYGTPDVKTCSMVSEAIAANYAPEDLLIVASTDMSHYHPYDIAREKDRKCIDLITHMDLEGLASSLGQRESELCGMGPVITMMILTSALGGSAKELKYANSGDTAGTESEVVGYASIAFYTEKKLELKKTGSEHE
ncbi:MAG: AmmeMemoRadiSam system protein B [Vulcanimicrobiota bacterium]